LRRPKCTADGIAIAWAISEELIGLGAYALFATHFTALSELADLYPNAKLWHFSVERSAQVRSLAQFKKLMSLRYLLSWTHCAAGVSLLNSNLSCTTCSNFYNEPSI